MQNDMQIDTTTIALIMATMAIIRRRPAMQYIDPAV